MKIGDLVYNKHYGIGKIIYDENNVFNFYGVEFENYNSNLNDLDGRCKDGYGYWCRDFDITPYKFTKKDLKDGYKLTTRGGAELIFINTDDYDFVEYDFVEISKTKTRSLQFLGELNEDLTMINRECSIDDIVKVERPTYKTIFERADEKEETLDKKEKEYLASVIRPFKDKVKYIKKDDLLNNKECIVIVASNGYVPFPKFEQGTMYKGMELDKNYTLKELGLD